MKIIYKYFGYKNSKTMRLIGSRDGGEWVQVSYIKYLWLKFSGFIVKKEKK